jgi:hypothetical protein
MLSSNPTERYIISPALSLELKQKINMQLQPQIVVDGKGEGTIFVKY